MFVERFPPHMEELTLEKNAFVGTARFGPLPDSEYLRITIFENGIESVVDLNGEPMKYPCLHEEK